MRRNKRFRNIDEKIGIRIAGCKNTQQWQKIGTTYLHEAASLSATQELPNSLWQPAIGPHPELDESSPYNPILLL
jgi:hypothetical protein